MNNICFSDPVRLTLKSGRECVVANVWEAIECLSEKWPESARGRTYRAAYHVCRDALDGWRDSREARKAFVKAGRRAGLLVPQSNRSRPRQAGFPRSGWTPPLTPGPCVRQ
ncbi:DUF982 domain-containing protein [Methylovirgula sp. 4M-Z18]|uniref:DUF982 domain-containing protein n=1 Tax=Methylovirgula sp. 4M-Z18 TaxID=2293567 RepID=UPI000E2E78CD|nr:DUF982 domain-containing protein [Methylovirgula sp. 4M-Z18]RFB76706.1 DUF982 domain-containing protein [Methylovirgula sp. 4M-Z18]